MIDVTHSCEQNRWLDNPAMAHTEYESSYLLPQMMGALASESGSVPVGHHWKKPGYRISFMSLLAPILCAIKLRFSLLNHVGQHRRRANFPEN
ncbi:hypothetical protein K9857_16580 [Pseudomonas sp. REP124]|uniref:hypothetical protein n=1 Tax=Pseudomonas sp. REP124 TaxID=2875731 RepID=UPI001CCAF261|nr:hypothetical protein [Pseudomonas sp. REP124]MBZ9783146.1 hypothetical protein [Pseudomonas sp. REP124]